jgi:hypothetical protein
LSNPWDPFPFPQSGDPEDSLTYEGVGRVLSEWEAIEFHLARLYSIFVGDADGVSLQQYGTGRIFRDRLDRLQAASEKYFVGRPNQDLEAACDCLRKIATGYADRRNDVAHGMVFPVHGMTFFEQMRGSPSDKPHYLLIPPYYVIREHDGGLPAYGYSFTELWTLRIKLRTFGDQINRYRLTLIR